MSIVWRVRKSLVGLTVISSDNKLIYKQTHWKYWINSEVG